MATKPSLDVDLIMQTLDKFCQGHVKCRLIPLNIFGVVASC